MMKLRRSDGTAVLDEIQASAVQLGRVVLVLFVVDSNVVRAFA
jgi:hypothetical protein